MKRIILADDHLRSVPHKFDLDLWESLGACVQQTKCTTEDDLVRECRDATVIIYFGNDLPFTDRVLVELEECVMILRIGTGFDSVDLEAATRLGIVVANCAGYCREEVAVHAMTLLLMCNRQIAHSHQAVRDGEWSFTDVKPVQERLSERTLGIVGLGRIGGTVARLMRPMVNRLLVSDPFVSKERVVAHGGEQLALEELLRESDLVTLHLPLTSQTRGLIGRRELELMKRGAFLVNTARGPIVDQDALLQALQQQRLAGAGLDVLQEEPPPTPLSELFQLPNVVITGHIAACSRSARQDLWRIASKSVSLLLQGHLPETIVNPEVQPRGNLVRANEGSQAHGM